MFGDVSQKKKSKMMVSKNLSLGRIDVARLPGKQYQTVKGE